MNPACLRFWPFNNKSERPVELKIKLTMALATTRAVVRSRNVFRHGFEFLRPLRDAVGHEVASVRPSRVTNSEIYRGVCSALWREMLPLKLGLMSLLHSLEVRFPFSSRVRRKTKWQGCAGTHAFCYLFLFTLTNHAPLLDSSRQRVSVTRR